MDIPKNEVNNVTELTKEERVNLENRAKILVDEANEAFNHFLSSIDSLNNKISSLFQIFLVIISIEVVILTPYFQNDVIKSVFSKLLLFSVILSGLVSLILLIYLLCPKPMRDISIFEEKRFNELCNLDSLDLLQDFLYQMKESYQFVVPIYNQRVKYFYLSYIFVILMTVLYILLIVSLIVS